jgi:hypothetical protein
MSKRRVFRPRSPDATLTKRLGSLKSIRAQNVELIFRDKATVWLFNECEDSFRHPLLRQLRRGDGVVRSSLTER